MSKFAILEHLKASAEASKNFVVSLIGEIAGTVADALEELARVKADSSTSITSALLASAWVGTDSPFTQELVIEGLDTTQNGTISISHNATVLQRDAARNALLSVIGQEAGKLVIAADGEMPNVDIPVVVVLLD